MHYLVTHKKDRWGTLVNVHLIVDGESVGTVWGYYNVYENYQDFYGASDLKVLSSRYPHVMEGEAMRIAEVDHSYLDTSLRGRGLGQQMYLRYAREQWDLNGGNPFIFIPQSCNDQDGTTSEMALNVWCSLARKYPSSGQCVVVDNRSACHTEGEHSSIIHCVLHAERLST